MEQVTLGIVKPDAVSKKYLGSIIQKLEAGGLSVVALENDPYESDASRGFLLRPPGKGPSSGV